MVKVKEAFFLACGCPWRKGRLTRRPRLSSAISTLGQRLSVNPEANTIENAFKLGEIPESHLKEKALRLFNESIPFDINPRTLEVLENTWSEELDVFVTLTKMNKNTTAYDNVYICVSSLKNRIPGKSDHSSIVFYLRCCS